MVELIRTLAKGGYVMIPLAACSLASLAVMVERFVALRRAGADSTALMSRLRGLLARRDHQGALAECRAAQGSVPQVLAAGLESFLAGAPSPEPAMEERALIELTGLNRRLVVLDTVVTIAPLLGLLGTVTGMIGAFHIVAGAGTSHPTGITAGIAEALIATATGLVIAILSLVGYNYFLDRVKRITSEIEIRGTQLSNMLGSQQGSAAETPLMIPHRRVG